MAKHPTPSQISFSFFEEVEKQEPQPSKHVLKPPQQIIVPAETESEKEISIDSKIFADEVAMDESNASKITAAAPSTTTFANGDRKNQRGRKSAKEYADAASLIEMPDDETLHAKHYYSMGEVTSMLNENHSLIRYWETEFDILKPKKNGKGDRFFRPADVKNLYLIYDLLRRRKFTIEGAKEYLKNNKSAEEKFAAIQSLEKIKQFFLQLKAGL